MPSPATPFGNGAQKLDSLAGYLCAFLIFRCYSILIQDGVLPYLINWQASSFSLTICYFGLVFTVLFLVLRQTTILEMLENHLFEAELNKAIADTLKSTEERIKLFAALLFLVLYTMFLAGLVPLPNEPLSIYANLLIEIVLLVVSQLLIRSERGVRSIRIERPHASVYGPPMAIGAVFLVLGYLNTEVFPFTAALGGAAVAGGSMPLLLYRSE